MLRNSEITYGLVTRLLGMIPLGYWMTSIPLSDFRWTLFNLHKATGTLILILVIVRILWQVSNVQLAIPQTLPLWQVRLAKLTAGLLYCLMVIVPVTGFTGSLTSGYAISFYGLFSIPALSKHPMISSLCWDIHGVAPYVLLGLVAMHAMAAIYHHVILKDDVLNRMLKGT